MNCILLEQSDFISPQRVVLQERRLQHVLQVHRATVGETLKVGAINGLLGRGRVERLDEQGLEMTVELDTPPPSEVGVRLIVALPRPKSLRKVVMGAVCMGVKQIVFVNSWRVEKSYWQSPLLQPPALRELCLVALEQAVDTVMPTISLKARFKPFVEDELEEFCAGTTRIVAHPYDAPDCMRGPLGPLSVAVGPEGGFIPYEIELLKQRGFSAVNLGERILRVEDAVVALLGRLI
jgi:RsmE family RNA methyltransferase